MMKSNILLFTVFIYFVLDYFFLKDFLFQLSLPHIKYIRSNVATPTLDKVSLLFAELGDKYGIAAILLVCYPLLPTVKAY